MKIAVIGGAGVRTVMFINGLLKRCRGLNIHEVALFDIDAGKLKQIGALCEYLVRKSGEELKITLHTEGKEAVIGADYVVTTIRVGGDQSRVTDEETALRLGLIGQETTGAGGFSMAFRTIPVMLKYCSMIQKYAPDAWIFNFTNPSGLVTQAMHNAGFSRVIGICDAPSSVKYRMAEYLKLPEEDLYVEFFGLNHLSWIRSVKTQGREIMPQLINDDRFLKDIREFSIFDPELIRMQGMLPNEYLYYYYHRELALDNIHKAGMTRGKNIMEINRNMMCELEQIDMDKEPEQALQTFLYFMQIRENSYMSIEAKAEGNKKGVRGKLEVPEDMGYAGVMLDCIQGLQGEKDRYLVLSVENKSAVPGLRPEDVVEMTCRVGGGKINPVQVEAPDPSCLLLMQVVKRYERLAAEAAVEQSYTKAVKALMIHPLVNSYSLAKNLINEYKKAYGYSELK